LVLSRSATGLTEESFLRQNTLSKFPVIGSCTKQVPPKVRVTLCIPAAVHKLGARHIYTGKKKKGLNTIKILLNNFKLNILCLDF